MSECVRGRGERGAALVLAIAFMLVVGAVGSAVVTSLASGVNGRVVLDHARDRQYAADGAIEAAIAQVRGQGATGAGMAGCTAAIPPGSTLNNVKIRVDCANVPTFLAHGVLERNALFTACLDKGTPCNDATAIIRAQVNFETPAATTVITRTWIQSWNVRG